MCNTYTLEEKTGKQAECFLCCIFQGHLNDAHFCIDLVMVSFFLVCEIIFYDFVLLHCKSGSKHKYDNALLWQVGYTILSTVLHTWWKLCHPVLNKDTFPTSSFSRKVALSSGVILDVCSRNFLRGESGSERKEKHLIEPKKTDLKQTQN